MGDVERKPPKPSWPVPAQPVVRCAGCGQDKNRLSVYVQLDKRRLCLQCMQAEAR